MAWNAIDTNWEYSDNPNVDKKTIDTYDYDLRPHTNGIIFSDANKTHYVLARQINHPHPGYGELVNLT